MQDRPTYAELLDAVREFLEADVVPALDGTKKFHARVAANVVAIVARELALADRQREDEWRRLDALLGAAAMPPERDAVARGLRDRTETVCARIRAGEADDGPWRAAVVAHVRATVLEKLAIDNPKLLARVTAA
jgi:hypothetical protein